MIKISTQLARMRMGIIPYKVAFLVLVHSFLFQTCLHNYCLAVGDPIATKARETLEIIIGVGGESPPPAEAPAPPDDENCTCQGTPPPPPPASTFVFESKRIELVYPVIQRLKEKITCDPHSITDTWEGPDICDKYKGFRCAIVPDYGVIGLSDVQFNEYNFNGPDLTLDGFIDELPDLSIFHANSNNFTGVIPKEVANIKYLFELDLSNNNFSGEFPYDVLGARNLTFLDLRYNSFGGVVPPQVFTLDLDVLFINNNNFQQKLPHNLGSLPVLYLTLANNKFTGPIPSSIGGARNTLAEILFLNNQLSGCLPSEIGLLNKVTLFDASRNLLTGPIPYSFGCLASLKILNLANNQLYGTIPDSVCNLPNLGNFSLSYNYFTGVGWACRKLIHKGVLDVRMNCIPGLPNQRSKAECDAFLCKPKSCTNQRSLNWMPCRQSYRQMTRPDKEAAAPALTYNALHPHRP